MKIQLDGFFLYLCKVLSAYHVRLVKRMVQKNIIAQFSFELRPRKKKDEQNYHIGVGALCANFNICDNGLSQT